FEFAQMEPNGCGGHPNLRDHRKMAEQLIPFLGKLFDN
ncbi:MAG TPA: GDSL family lipase, partial [Leeuwenhoekiella sp.]|nr:GDSL family lipase [Leeuwenhoekiella sp.]